MRALALFVLLLAAGCVQTTQIVGPDVQYTKEDVQFVTPDGVLIKGNLYFPQTGADKYPILILAHQLNGDRSQWDDFIPFLIERNYAALAYDMRGMGESIKSSNGTDFVKTDAYFDEMPNDVAGAIILIASKDEIDKSHIGIIGASVGANVAYVSVGKYPAINVAVAMSPSSQRLTSSSSPSFSPHHIFFLSDQAESDASQLLAANTKEPTLVRVYQGTAHGVELLNNQLAVNDIFDWLSKYL